MNRNLVVKAINRVLVIVDNPQDTLKNDLIPTIFFNFVPMKTVHSKVFGLCRVRGLLLRFQDVAVCSANTNLFPSNVV